jgi:hypothetical protein
MSSAHFMNMFSRSWVQRQILLPTNLGDLSHDMVTKVYQTFSAVTSLTEIKINRGGSSFLLRGGVK